MSSGLLTSLFQIIEVEKQDKKLYDLLMDTVSSYRKVNEVVYEVVFNNGIKVTISKQFDNYHLFISDHQFYEWGETPYSQMSNDRVMHYLKMIAEFKYNTHSNERVSIDEVLEK